MAGLVWGLFVNRAAALFFAPRGGEGCDWLEARSRPSICWAARDVGERSLVKAEAAGGGGRRPAFTRVRSPTTIAWRASRGRGDVRLPLLSSTRVGGPSKRVAHSQPRRLRCRRHETAPYAHRFGWVRSGSGTHATDRRGGGV